MEKAVRRFRAVKTQKIEMPILNFDQYLMKAKIKFCIDFSTDFYKMREILIEKK